MAITELDRKRLWAKSGNLCAICKQELVRPNPNNEDYNIGEECHIVSSKHSGPRHESGWENYDTYDNLILLCRNHHREIDNANNVSLYPKSRLHEIKAKHESWVKKCLSSSKQSDSVRIILSGSELLHCLTDVLGIEHTNDPIIDKESAKFIGSIWQTLIDYLDICTDIEPANIPLVELELQSLLYEITQNGYLLYGNRSSRVMKFGDGTTERWPVAKFRLVINKDANSGNVL